MSPLPNVYRIESHGEIADPFPTLNDAMRSPPTHAEGCIATSPEGLILAESMIKSSSRKQLRVRYEWRVTVAGLDVLEGGVRGMRAAS